eukprot:1893111-Amphidinium_carterae.1
MIATEETSASRVELVSVSIGIDSGCEQHCGPARLLQQIATRKQMAPPPLRTASGADLEVEGVYVLNYISSSPSGKVMRFTADVVACNVTKMLFSVGVLEDNGFMMVLSQGFPMLQVDYCNDGIMETIPLKKQGRSYYMEVMAEAVHPRVVAPLE